MQIIVAMQLLLALIEQRTRPIARRYRLSPEDYLLLSWLRSNVGLELHFLARNTGRNKQNVRRGLQRLARRHLVRACPEDERDRIGSYGLTDEGLRVAQEVETQFTQIEDHVFGSREKAAEALRYLKHLAAEVGKATAPPHLRTQHISHFCFLLDDRLPPVASERTT